MNNRLVLADITGAIAAVSLYALIALIFACAASADDLQLHLAPKFIYLAMYAIYFALYAGGAVVLCRTGSPIGRLAFGLLAATGVLALIGVAFIVGWWVGFALLLIVAALTLGTSGLAGALIAIPIVGAAVGWAMTHMIARLGRWPSDHPNLGVLRQTNIAFAAIAACCAAIFVYRTGTGVAPPIGRERLLLELFAGLIGPALHAGSKLALLFRSGVGPEKHIPWSVLRQSRLELQKWPFALWLLGATVLGLVWVVQTPEVTNSKLWTRDGLATAFASASDLRRNRQPPPDGPLPIGNFLVDRRPDVAVDGGYDWPSKRYSTLTVPLGVLDTPDGRAEIRLSLNALGQRGLAYLCDEPSEDSLAPCRVVEWDQHLKNDPRIVRVGLYSGRAQMGRIGRPFLIGCRSDPHCAIVFAPPWFDGVGVTLGFHKKYLSHWAEIVRFSIPLIEDLVRRAN